MSWIVTIHFSEPDVREHFRAGNHIGEIALIMKRVIYLTFSKFAFFMFIFVTNRHPNKQHSSCYWCLIIAQKPEVIAYTVYTMIEILCFPES